MTEENSVCVSATARLTVFLGRERGGRDQNHPGRCLQVVTVSALLVTRSREGSFLMETQSLPALLLPLKLNLEN